MKLIYLTSKKYPSTTADHLFVLSMARAFTSILGDDFKLYIRGNSSSELNGVNTFSVNTTSRLRSVFYFFWIPIFVINNKHNNKRTVFFSNDPYLLSILIFWRKILRLKYLVCSDWHQLFEDWRDKYIALNSDYLISTSKKLRETILNTTQISENKILVAYGGADLQEFENISESVSELRKKLDLPVSDILVGYVGFYKTMGMEKGLKTMIEALRFIQDKSVKMVFVGGRGGEIKEYQKMAEDMGVADRVIFERAMPKEAIPTYERTLDILVIPYPDKPHFRHYGFPMKVYEYMASNKPIIYSNLPIIAEILADCGLSSNPDDSKDLADKIKSLINDPSVAHDLGSKALEKVESFTWQKRAQHIIDFIKSE